jgi:hypothetical protein
MQERTYCEGCGTYRFKEAAELCFHCQRKPAETGAASAVSPASISCSESERVISPVSPAPGFRPESGRNVITFANVTVTAPGYTSESFEKALCRAFVDELVIVQDQTGQDVVCHAGTNGGYFTTRESCSCKAGSCGTPCKHRAFWIFVHDVRLPIQRRQWAAARKAVAA